MLSTRPRGRGSRVAGAARAARAGRRPAAPAPVLDRGERELGTIILGLPVYNFGAPSSVKAWVDHLIAPGLSLDPATNEGRLGGRDLVVLASRGGYGSGTPREGWDHAEQRLPTGCT